MSLNYYNPFSPGFLMHYSLPFGIDKGTVKIKILHGFFNRLFNRWKTYDITYIGTNYGDSRNYGVFPVLFSVTTTPTSHIEKTYMLNWKDKICIDDKEYSLSLDNLKLINHDLNILKTLNKLDGDCIT